jgi:OsmC-like protein
VRGGHTARGRDLARDPGYGVRARGGRPRLPGTLGVDREAPVGFRAIRLRFDLETDASDEQLDTLLRLTERYCVVYQSLAASPELSVSRP